MELVKLFSCHVNMLTKCYNVLYSFLFILVFPTHEFVESKMLNKFVSLQLFLCIVLCAKD